MLQKFHINCNAKEMSPSPRTSTRLPKHSLSHQEGSAEDVLPGSAKKVQLLYVSTMHIHHHLARVSRQTGREQDYRTCRKMLVPTCPPFRIYTSSDWVTTDPNSGHKHDSFKSSCFYMHIIKIPKRADYVSGSTSEILIMRYGPAGERWSPFSQVSVLVIPSLMYQ